MREAQRTRALTILYSEKHLTNLTIGDNQYERQLREEVDRVNSKMDAMRLQEEMLKATRKQRRPNNRRSWWQNRWRCLGGVREQDLYDGEMDLRSVRFQAKKCWILIEY